MVSVAVHEDGRVRSLEKEYVCGARQRDDKRRGDVHDSVSSYAHENPPVTKAATNEVNDRDQS
jgi:hypothetical protein